jgi:phosphate transport system substrate-binding protein
MKYPFSRVLYFLTNEAYYGLGNGWIRFSCQQLGQIVVQKEGLQPYNIFKREVQMR